MALRPEAEAGLVCIYAHCAGNTMQRSKRAADASTEYRKCMEIEFYNWCCCCGECVQFLLVVVIAFTFYILHSCSRLRSARMAVSRFSHLVIYWHWHAVAQPLGLTHGHNFLCVASFAVDSFYLRYSIGSVNLRK